TLHSARTSMNVSRRESCAALGPSGFTCWPLRVSNRRSPRVLDQRLRTELRLPVVDLPLEPAALPKVLVGALEQCLMYFDDQADRSPMVWVASADRFGDIEGKDGLPAVEQRLGSLGGGVWTAERDELGQGICRIVGVELGTGLQFEPSHVGFPDGAYCPGD